jgi:hypothetical protein
MLSVRTSRATICLLFGLILLLQCSLFSVHGCEFSFGLGRRMGRRSIVISKIRSLSLQRVSGLDVNSLLVETHRCMAGCTTNAL